MTDKVISGLEACINQAKKDVYCDESCPYYKPFNKQARLLCWTKLNIDALKLIKEQQEIIEKYKKADWQHMTENESD